MWVLEDLDRDIWSIKSFLPYKVTAAVSAVEIGGIVYMCGGFYATTFYGQDESIPADCARRVSHLDAGQVL